MDRSEGLYRKSYRKYMNNFAGLMDMNIMYIGPFFSGIGGDAPKTLFGHAHK